MTQILVLDNYDSFTFTLVGYLQELGAQVTVIRNDQLGLDQATQLAQQADGILISPGPGNPSQAGITLNLIRWAEKEKKPLLGVCLGHQALAQVYGGKISQAPQLMHGKTSQISHQQTSVFAGLPSPLTVTRYHSLALEAPTLPAELEVTAQTTDGVIMGLRHRTAPLEGVQFHPESVLTQGGYQMLGNWLESLGLAGAAQRGRGLSPL